MDLDETKFDLGQNFWDHLDEKLTRSDILRIRDLFKFQDGSEKVPIIQFSNLTRMQILELALLYKEVVFSTSTPASDTLHILSTVRSVGAGHLVNALWLRRPEAPLTSSLYLLSLFFCSLEQKSSQKWEAAVAFYAIGVAR